MRTLNTIRGTDLIMHELSHFRCDAIGLTETHWTGTQELAVSRCKIINSGREGNHTASVDLVLSNLAPKCMLRYRPVND